MRRSTATTLQDIAREVGVATITASVVLNGSRSATRVSEATRAKIHEAAARLHYRPNGVARGLTRRRMDTVGVVGRFRDQEVNVYFLEILSGILEASARNNQNTTVMAVANWRDEQNKILQFCDGRIDGLVLVGPESLNEEFTERLITYAPYVTLHSSITNSPADDLDIDDEGGFFDVVSHLTALGHRRIAHFTGDLKRTGARLRTNGYRRALDAAGIPFDESLVFAGDFNAETGAASTRELLTRFPAGGRPTAIACVNDTVASACLEVLASHGVSVPGQMSVTGFDDTAVSRMSSPALTTVRQPLHEMGGKSVERLLFRIQESLDQPKQSPGSAEDPETPLAPPVTEVFPVQLIVRGSTGPAPRID